MSRRITGSNALVAAAALATASVHNFAGLALAAAVALVGALIGLRALR